MWINLQFVLFLSFILSFLVIVTALVLAGVTDCVYVDEICCGVQQNERSKERKNT